MNLNKDPSSWARVVPDAALQGSRAQQVNVLQMAIEDIAKLSTELDRLHAASTNLIAAIDNMHERGETFTARVSIACADMRRALQ